MSFFDKLASAAKQAAEVTKHAAAAAAESARTTYSDLKSEPVSVTCSNCKINVEVPADAFNWRCINGHMNDKSVTACTTCHSAKPSKLPAPLVSCPVCKATTEVPSSNLLKSFKDAGEKTKQLAGSAAASTKATYTHLTSAPETFHCSHCDTLLAVPTGPWACQTCTTVNGEDVKKCSKCGQSKSEQKAICGVCHQSTRIPVSNLMNSIRHTSREVAQSSRKVYYDVSKKPYATCPRCQTHVSIDPSTVPPAPASATASATAATATPDANVTAPQSGNELHCPSCKHSFEKPTVVASAGTA